MELYWTLASAIFLASPFAFIIQTVCFYPSIKHLFEHTQSQAHAVETTVDDQFSASRKMTRTVSHSFTQTTTHLLGVSVPLRAFLFVLSVTHSLFTLSPSYFHYNLRAHKKNTTNKYQNDEEKKESNRENI